MTMKRLLTRTARLAAIACLCAVVIGDIAWADDAADGKRLFNKCRACHTLEPGKTRIGPSLHGVIGRRSASLPGFNYSEAMRQANVVWDEATLDAFLEDPRAFVPGTKMTFPGLKKAAERRAVIAFLKAHAR